MRRPANNSSAPAAVAVTITVMTPYSVDVSSYRGGSPSWVPPGVDNDTSTVKRPARSTSAGIFRLRDRPAGTSTGEGCDKRKPELAVSCTRTVTWTGSRLVTDTGIGEAPEASAI